MKTKQLITLLFCALTTTLFAQTKLIAHKSHSGSAKNFKTAITNKLFNMPNSNFGMAPEPFIRKAKLDSVIFVGDTVAVMVTSEYCTERMYHQNDNNGTLWRAGKDTVYNHPLFTKEHSLDSIKTVLKQDYYFRNSIDSTKFIGFDNKKPKPAKVKPVKQQQLNQQNNEPQHNNQQNVVPPAYIDDNDNTPPTPKEPYWLIGVIALFSTGIGFIFLKISELKQAHIVLHVIARQP